MVPPGASYPQSKGRAGRAGSPGEELFRVVEFVMSEIDEEINKVIVIDK